MNHISSNISNSQLLEDTISYLNSHLTKQGKSLLLILYKYQPIHHKRLAEILDIQTSGLSNLMKRIDETYHDFIEYQTEGRNKLYSLSQIAKVYTENELLPEEAARKQVGTSFLHTDPSLHNVLECLRKFQEFEGDDWDIALDDLLLAEKRNNGEIKDDPTINTDFKEETYQNYTSFKNAMMTLIVQYGQPAAQKVYDIIEQKVLIKRLEYLFSCLLEDFHLIEPLFLLEKENLQASYSIIDLIFSKCCPTIFRIPSRPLPREYNGSQLAISKMIDEFKDNNYDKNVSIAQWEKKFYTKEHFSCLSYIAEKCSTVYIRQ